MPDRDKPTVVTASVDGGHPRVVFLHGLMGHGKNFATVARALAPEHGAIMVDLPNHGDSAWTDSSDYSQMADAVAEVVSDQAEGRAAVVGHSMGGKVAMVLALRHPELVDRLMVVDISPIETDGMSQFTHLLGTIAGLDLTTISSRADADAALRSPIPDDAVRGFLLQNLRWRDGAWRWRANVEVLLRDLGAIGGFPADAARQSYDGPVLWVAGGDSPYIKDEHADEMRRLFPLVRKVTVKNAGHWVHADQTATFIELLRRFLEAGEQSDGAGATR